MKIILSLVLSIFIYNLSFAQFFEGTLTYKVEFEIETMKFKNVEVNKEQIIEKMKKEGAYFDTITTNIKNGNYIKKDNSSQQNTILYRSDSNKVFTFAKDIGSVMTIDAKNSNILNLEFDKPKIEILDSIKVINGIDCKILKLSFDPIGEEYYFYNSKIAKLNKNLFKGHNYEYFNEVIAITNSYPLEIIKKTNGLINTRMTLLSVKEEKLNDKIFDVESILKDIENKKVAALNEKIDFYKNKAANWNLFKDKKIGYSVEYPENWIAKGSKGAFMCGLEEGFQNSEFIVMWSSLKDKERIDFLLDDEFYEGYTVVEKPVKVNGLNGTYSLRTHKDKPNEYYESVVLKNKTSLFVFNNSGYNNDWFEYFYNSFKTTKKLKVSK